MMNEDYEHNATTMNFALCNSTYFDTFRIRSCHLLGVGGGFYLLTEDSMHVVFFSFLRSL